MYCRFVGIFRFICDDVFGPFPQRAYASPCEKWELVVACLQHFQMWVEFVFLVLFLTILYISVRNFVSSFFSFIHGSLKLIANNIMCRMLSMYDIKDEDIDSVNTSQHSLVGQSAPLEMQLPVLELMKVLLFLFLLFVLWFLVAAIALLLLLQLYLLKSFLWFNCMAPIYLLC